MSKSLNLSYRRLMTIANNNKVQTIDIDLFLYPLVIITEYHVFMWLFCKLFNLL